MKKTLLALAILASGTASAAVELYNTDGVKLETGGAAEVQFKKTRVDGEKAKFRLDDGDLFFNAEMAIDEDLSAVGKVAFKFESEDVKNDELYVGLKSNKFGTFTVGRQTTVFDDAGIGQDIEFGFNFFDDRVDAPAIGSADSVGKYVYKTESGFFKASYAEDKEEKGQEAYAYDLAVGYNINDLELAAYYQRADSKEIENDSRADITLKNYLVQAKYKISDFTLGASHSLTDAKADVDTFIQGGVLRGKAELDINITKLSAAYALTDKTTVAGGYEFGDFDFKNVAKGDAKNYYVNVSHKLHKNAKVYAELGKTDVKGADLGYAAGLEVKF